ncbi:unnamed protein product [Adineta ricciae]|uniref:Doublecortin domain-containing protein n=1 Tax=Adineta ricciae TaxID=249248 RepID=A0A814HYR2_ADIRI|nr:unnamed protein product [Adineta ricciae]
MSTEYEQPPTQRSYQHYNQQPYQQYEPHSRQQYDQQYEPRGRQQYDQHHESRAHQQYDQPNDTRRNQQYDQHPYQQYDQQYDQREAQQRVAMPERGRAIRLLRNGDPYFTGRTFVINQRRYPVFDVFLDDASQALRANFGAVRCIYTPKHGTRLKDITEFEDHRTYVAGGGERFKKLHYLDIAEGKRVATRGQGAPKIIPLPPVRRIDAEGRALKLSRSENVIIYVYRNGDPLTLPAKVLLVKSILQSWDSVLDEITRKVSLPNTAVLKLYTMNGDLVVSAHQLEYNGMYVGAGKERFRRIDYPDPKSFSANSSPKMSRKSSKHQLFVVRPQLRLPPLQKRVDDSSTDHDHRGSSSEGHHRYIKGDGMYTYTTTTATSYGSNETAGQRRPVREEYDFFNHKPQQHRRGPVKETDLDRDDGGIYKGRLNHHERVREIDETHDTKVDLPVEHRQIETVEDENFHGNAGRIPRPPQHQPAKQTMPDTRRRPSKTPPKAHKNDNHRYPNANHRNHNPSNGYDRRSPTQSDDDLKEHRQSFVTSNSLANKNKEEQAATVIQSHVRGYLTRKQTQEALKQRETYNGERNGYPYCQPSQTNERGYDKTHNYT